LYIHIRLHKGHAEFAWDEVKNRINKRKHGVSFETASFVFDDPHHLTRQDREVDGEPGWQTIGVANGVHLLLVAHTIVAHTVTESDEEIRIVSARKATRSERRLYAQGKQDH
jgi:uncharacterized DUF497 family protein